MESVFSTNIIYALISISFLLFGGYIFFEYSRGKKKTSEKLSVTGTELTELEKVKELKLIKSIKKPMSVKERQSIFEKAYQRKYPEAYKEYVLEETEKLLTEKESQIPISEQEQNSINNLMSSSVLIEEEQEPSLSENPINLFSEQDEEIGNSKNETEKLEENFNEKDFIQSDEYKNREKPQAVNPLEIKKNVLGRKFSQVEEMHLQNMIKTTKQIYDS